MKPYRVMQTPPMTQVGIVLRKVTNDNRNLFTASVILIAGIGGMTMNIGSVTLTEVACALILGVIVNVLFNRPAKDKE